MSKDRKEYMRKYWHDYYLKNKNEILAKQKEYQHKNKEYISKRHKKYNQKIKANNNILTELEEWLQSIIYEIEPMGCRINYNCEYDSEEDYINAMKEQSKLNTLKIIKDKIQELKEKYNGQ